MEKVVGKRCPTCKQKLVLRCHTCHKNRSTCRNEYCTGESELVCQNCKKTYYMSTETDYSSNPN